ncbi:MAG: serine/threonine-protein kinase [Polyangiaceae bacterium]
MTTTKLHPAEEAPRAPNLVPPAEHAGYLLGRTIGRGGMGTVRAALRRGTFGIAQLVAVKTMTSGAIDPEAREAFIREARILARLSHPNVVRWHDAAETPDGIHIAMELLHGAPLSRLLAASPAPLPLPAAIAILLDLARGLHAAHELTAEDGTPRPHPPGHLPSQRRHRLRRPLTRLVDFGIARLASVDASRHRHRPRQARLPRPEQLRRPPPRPRRTDLFALGVVAFELLTARRLFARSSIAETHTAVLFDPIPDLAAARPDLPAPSPSSPAPSAALAKTAGPPPNPSAAPSPPPAKSPTSPSQKSPK